MDVSNLLKDIEKIKERVIQIHEHNACLIRENERLRDENSKLLIDVAFYDGRMEDKRTSF